MTAMTNAKHSDGNPTPKKAVRFDQTERGVQETISRLEYTKEEIASSWYSKAEYLQIKTENTENMYQMLNDLVAVDGEKYCTYGLNLPCEMDRTLEVKKEAVREVLAEQCYQLNNGIKDSEIVADVYFEITREVQFQAEKRARRIATEVRINNLPFYSAFRRTFAITQRSSHFFMLQKNPASSVSMYINNSNPTLPLIKSAPSA